MTVHIRVLKMLNNIVILFPLKKKLLKTHFLKWFKENIVKKKTFFNSNRYRSCRCLLLNCNKLSDRGWAS